MATGDFEGQAWSHLKQGQYDLATQEFSVIMANGELADHDFAGRSMAYFGQKKFEKAVVDAKTCLQLNPSSPKGHLALAKALYALEKWHQALAICEAGIVHGDHEPKLAQIQERCMLRLAGKNPDGEEEDENHHGHGHGHHGHHHK